ncbi:FK506-binding protein 1 [Peziza echinospora]|nr:FK506-binding protein 1 [Peziza echinospora]
MPVTKHIIREGDKKHFPKREDVVDIRYTGTFENGTIFDESRTRNDYFRTVIGVGSVIRGWDEAVPTMSIGEQAILTISSDYGYGDRGFPGLIPPNATIIL